MTNEVAVDIAEYLHQQGVGTWSTTIFAGQMPEEIDTVLCVYPYGGDPADLIVPLEFPRVQVRTRSKVYATGYDLCYAAFQKLHQATDLTINSVLYKRIDALQSPQLMGKDEVQRFNFFCNFKIIKVVG